MAPEDHRWLSAEQQESWLELARLLAWLPAALDGQLQRDAGLTHFEYAILGALSETPQRMLPMSGLAAMANGSLSRASHVVKRLEQRGWVRRARATDNRRVINAVLTAEGHAQIVASAPGHVAEVRRLVIDVLSPGQLRRLADGARRLNSAHGPSVDWRTGGRSPTGDDTGIPNHDDAGRPNQS